jgi:large subunit ribosomal protein L4
MKAKVYSKDGKDLREIEVDDAVFGLPYNESVVWRAIENERANARLGTADTKTRKEVHGSNAKPYKQKGTGHARRGDKKSPVLVGGGVVFGPHPRDFGYSIPKKEKRLAMKTILSLKAQSGSLKVVEDFSIESGKTKELAGVLTSINGKYVKYLSEDDKKNKKKVPLNTLSTVIIDGEEDAKNRLAGRNIPWLNFLTFNRLSAHTLFYGRNVLIMESAAKQLCDFYKNLGATEAKA